MAEQDQHAQVRETGDLRDQAQHHERQRRIRITAIDELDEKRQEEQDRLRIEQTDRQRAAKRIAGRYDRHDRRGKSEEHTSELQSLMRISYAVFCLKKKTTTTTKTNSEHKLNN